VTSGAGPDTRRSSEDLRTAAKGCHGARPADLAFVGLCGTLKA
jgi:uncharacterized protein VirK/YbjX